MKQADVFTIIKDKSGRVNPRREIDHAFKLLFPGVVKKPMKIVKNEPHKDGQKDQRQKRYPFASIWYGWLTNVLQPQHLLLLPQHIVLLQGNILTSTLRQKIRPIFNIDNIVLLCIPL